MKLQAVELWRIKLSLVAPFETSFGVQTERDVLLLKGITDAGVGWGECVAGEEPLYSSEYVDAACDVLLKHLLPRLLDRELEAADVATVLRPVHGHNMAKAAIEMALLDAELRARGESFGHYLGAVRDKFGDVPLQVDANTAYTLSGADDLAKLDPYDLLLIEQPLPEDQVLAHAKLARLVRTPICLDESITSAQAAADAIELGACRIINIKPGRVGGYLEARRIHDVCAAHNLPVWMGGMLETGVGRAGNVAMATMPQFTLPGDTSASDRYYHRDITAPFVLMDGRLAVPEGPGLGVTVDDDYVESITHWSGTLGRAGVS